MKILVTKAVLFSKNLSDSAKVTLLLSEHIADSVELAKLRNLPIELVSTHLFAASKVEKLATQTDTLLQLCSAYVSAVQERFRKNLDQPNLRAAVLKVVKLHGHARTHQFLLSFVEGCRTLDEARIVNFYKKFGHKNLVR